MKLPLRSWLIGQLLLPAAASLLLASLAGCESTAAKTSATTTEAQQRAESEFESAVDRAPTPNTLYAMSRILATQRRDAECQALLSKIIQERPDFMPAYNDLAELQMRERHIDQAMATLHSGLKVSSRQPVLLNNLGMCQLIKTQYADALDSFTRAAALAPDDTRYRANMAVALGMQGRYDESLALYEQVGPLADAHYNLGVLAESRQDQTRAQAEFARAKALQAEADVHGGSRKMDRTN